MKAEKDCSTPTCYQQEGQPKKDTIHTITQAVQWHKKESLQWKTWHIW